MFFDFFQVYPDSSLQEFLEELDALCAPESVSAETDLENTKPCASEESFNSTSNGTANQNGCVPAEIAPLSPKVSEKKVRFAENHDENKSESETSASPITNGPAEEDGPQDDSESMRKEMKPPSPEQENGLEKLAELNPATEGSATEPSCPDVCISAEPGENQPVEHSKSCSSRGNGTRTLAA